MSDGMKSVPEIPARLWGLTRLDLFDFKVEWEQDDEFTASDGLNPRVFTSHDAAHAWALEQYDRVEESLCPALIAVDVERSLIDDRAVRPIECRPAVLWGVWSTHTDPDMPGWADAGWLGSPGSPKAFASRRDAEWLALDFNNNIHLNDLRPGKVYTASLLGVAPTCADVLNAAAEEIPALRR